MTWANQAIDISTRFGALIIPLWDSGMPVTKVNPEKHKDLPPEKLPTNDPQLIKHWARNFPAYGVVPKKEFLIVDIDVKEGQLGKQCLKFMVNQGFPTDTYCVKSPSGGLHFYVSHPLHYTPSQGAGHRVLFDDESIQEEWDHMVATEAVANSEEISTGVDTRYGWGYVVGPGSETVKGEYKLLNDNDLRPIPSSMFVGKRSTVKATNKKVSSNITAPTLGFKITKNRNNDALGFTMDLRKRNLPDDQARILIEKKIEDYDNSDGEAPTFEVMWDQYQRAGDKVNDIINDLLLNKIYVVKGELVLDIATKSVAFFREFKSEMRSKMVPIEIVKPNGDVSNKRVNPADAWMEDPDRLTVKDIIYDPRMDPGVVGCSMRDGYVDGTYFNTFAPPQIIYPRDNPATDLGDEIYEACMRVLDNVMSNKEDRLWFKKWIGVMLFSPGFRPVWHWHIFSNVRGIGKDTLVNLISLLYGEENCARYDSKIFTDEFNRDLFNHGLGILSDFTRVPSNRSSTANANFKQITGADSSRMRGMYQEGMQRPVNVRFIMLSNDGNDFPVDQGDRRLYKSQSDGDRLDSRTYTLVNLLINPNKIPQQQLDRYRIPRVTDADLDCAKARLFEMFRTCGYEDMFHQINCPRNETKDEYMDIAQISYITRINEYVRHKIFVCGSDLITEQTLQLLLNELNIPTKVRTVLSELKLAGVIKDVNRIVTGGKEVKLRVAMPMLKYDRDLDMLIAMGNESKYPVFALRNFEEWCDSEASRQCKRELMKIVGVRNIHTYEMKKKSDDSAAQL